ncbi:hypothetical protein Sden_0142 [Shewanella denitrificans OS217]|jgi:hypothetical protein|uniref:Lipoprotein n=1 Tax=Shewanella denitrificans (strain OS217 / ATCC BAA-1090 / DSM 15013) TaxID=318161 RepID=Q12SY7_SHEDO|nr:hypothetical protein [Shewanella denitrificans]ABE53439.1 hypothetical protein Sden_0142 [Shewanella denitrificans OS217]
MINSFKAIKRLGLGCTFVFGAVLVSGCQSAPELAKASAQTQPKIEIGFTEPKQIVFQGKGAGAGIALMSAMGPVGIAVGVAIDAGIAKDIGTVSMQQGFDIDAMLQQGLSAATTQDYQLKISAAEPSSVSENEPAVELSTEHTTEPSTELSIEDAAKVPKLQLVRFGYKIVPGENDATSAELIIQWHDNNHALQQIHYPNDFELSPNAPLAQLRTDGKLANKLMQAAIQAMWQRYFEQTTP